MRRWQCWDITCWQFTAAGAYITNPNHLVWRWVPKLRHHRQKNSRHHQMHNSQCWTDTVSELNVWCIMHGKVMIWEQTCSQLHCNNADSQIQLRCDHSHNFVLNSGVQKLATLENNMSMWSKDKQKEKSAMIVEFPAWWKHNMGHILRTGTHSKNKYMYNG